MKGWLLFKTLFLIGVWVVGNAVLFGIFFAISSQDPTIPLIEKIGVVAFAESFLMVATTALAAYIPA